MNKILISLLFLCFTLQVAVASPLSLFELKATDITGSEVDLQQYTGKVLLVVNTASRCGHTPQYGGLEQLYQKYKDKGFVVLGFPSNDFGGQEPGSNEEIASFCSSKFDVSFPMFSKTPVTGIKAHPVFQFLSHSNPEKGGEPQWNFHKYLVDRNGRVVASFASSVQPQSGELEKAIRGIL